MPNSQFTRKFDVSETRCWIQKEKKRAKVGIFHEKNSFLEKLTFFGGVFWHFICQYKLEL